MERKEKRTRPCMTIENKPYIFKQKQWDLWQETRTIDTLTIIKRLKRKSS
jgi:hypothetical protein